MKKYTTMGLSLIATVLLSACGTTTRVSKEYTYDLLDLPEAETKVNLEKLSGTATYKADLASKHVIFTKTHTDVYAATVELNADFQQRNISGTVKINMTGTKETPPAGTKSALLNLQNTKLMQLTNGPDLGRAVFAGDVTGDILGDVKTPVAGDYSGVILGKSADMISGSFNAASGSTSINGKFVGKADTPPQVK